MFFPPPKPNSDMQNTTQTSISKKDNEMKPSITITNPDGKNVQTVNLNSLRKAHMKKAFIDWCEVSTTHALSNLARAQHNLIFFIWAISLVASLGYCSYTIINILISFLSYQVLINLQVHHVTPVTFPAITVCNLNPFDRFKSNSYIEDIMNYNNITSALNGTIISESPQLILELVKSSLIANKSMTENERRHYGYDLDFMLLSCSFSGTKCVSSDFVYLYDYDYTNCFTFNSGYNSNGTKVDLKKISEAGADQGFKLELFLGEEKSQGKFMVNSGAHVAIHNQSVKPFVNQEGRDVATNYQTNLGIKRSFIKKLAAPYSECIENNTSPSSFNSEYYKAIFTRLNMTTYRQQTCQSLCLQRFIKDKCGCIDGSLPNIYYDDINVNVCQNKTTLNCVTQSRIDYFKADSTGNNCEGCPLECNQVTYDISFSISRYPTLYYTDYLRNKSNILSKFSNPNDVQDNAITKNIVLLNVYFDDISTTYVEEIAQITTDLLLGNIGGNLGLFVGMSALSFIEIIEIIIQLILIYCDKKKVLSKKMDPKKSESETNKY